MSQWLIARTSSDENYVFSHEVSGPRDVASADTRDYVAHCVAKPPPGFCYFCVKSKPFENFRQKRTGIIFFKRESYDFTRLSPKKLIYVKRCSC